MELGRYLAGKDMVLAYARLAGRGKRSFSALCGETALFAFGDKDQNEFSERKGVDYLYDPTYQPKSYPSYVRSTHPSGRQPEAVLMDNKYEGTYL